MKKKLKLLLVAGAALALAVTVTPALAGKGGKNAAGSSAVSTISLNPSATAPAFGGTVTFTTTVVGLQGPEYPMVYVECSSTADGSLLYGQLDHPNVGFVLGGGSSRWWTVRDSAHCLAHLYAYGGKANGYDTIRELAVPVAFDAAA